MSDNASASGWKHCTLGDVVTLQRGFDLPQKQRRDGTVPIVSSSGITGYHCVSKVAAPAVVTGRYGTLGEVFFLDQDCWPLNTTLYVRDFKGNDPRFISFFLKTLGLERYNGAGAVPGLNRNYLHTLEVSVPAQIGVQKQIAGVLGTYDDLITTNTNRIKILEEITRLLYREWFVRYRFPASEKVKMVHSGTELGEVPDGWKVGKYTDFIDVLSGGTPRTTVEEYWGGEIPFFTPKDAGNDCFCIRTEKNITELGLEHCNSRLYPKNTTFITARGTVGKCVLASWDMAMNQSCYALQGKNGVSPYFVFLATKNLVNRFKHVATGGVFDTITVNTFESTDFVLPPEEIIDAFHGFVQPVFELILTLLLQTATLKRTRDILLPKLVSGQLAVA